MTVRRAIKALLGRERMANSREADRLTKDFGKRLRACRIAAGYESAAAFSSDLGVQEERYRKYERGQSVPPLDVLQQACAMLDKSADFLLFGKSDRRA